MSLSSHLFLFIFLTYFSSLSFAQQQTITYNASPNGKYNSMTTNEFIIGDTSVRSSQDCTGITNPTGGKRVLINSATGTAYICDGNNSFDDIAWIPDRNTLYLSNIDDGKFGYLSPDKTTFSGIKFNEPNLSFFNGPIGNVTDDANALLSLSTTGVTMRGPSTSSSPINTNTYRPAMVLSNGSTGTTPTSNVGSAVGNHGAKRLALAEENNRFYGLGVAANTLEFHASSATNGTASNPHMVLVNSNTANTTSARLGINKPVPTVALDVVGAIAATQNLNISGSVGIGFAGAPTAGAKLEVRGGDIQATGGNIVVTTGKIAIAENNPNQGQLIIPVYTSGNKPVCAQSGTEVPGCYWIQQ